MDQPSAEFLFRKLGIAVEQIIREELEIAVLKPFLDLSRFSLRKLNSYGSRFPRYVQAALAEINAKIRKGRS